MGAEGFRVTGVHHVAIVVDDLDRARQFYCEALRLPEVPRPDFPTPGFWAQVGAQQLHVAQGDEPAPSRHHVALAVEDLDGMVRHLDQLGVSVRRSAAVVGAGTQAFVHDPWGNLVELNEQ